MADHAVLEAELHKARKRYSEQSRVLSTNEAIVASAVALPSLQRIANRRLPKLREIVAETVSVIAELEKALKIGSQPDLLDTKPSKKA